MKRIKKKKPNQLTIDFRIIGSQSIPSHCRINGVVVIAARYILRVSTDPQQRVRYGNICRRNKVLVGEAGTSVSVPIKTVLVAVLLRARDG